MTHVQMNEAHNVSYRFNFFFFSSSNSVNAHVRLSISKYFFVPSPTLHRDSERAQKAESALRIRNVLLCKIDI